MSRTENPEEVGSARSRPATADDDALSDVIARVAHELKTPISVSKGFAVTMRNGLSDMDEATLRRCCDAIIRGLTSAENLVQSLAQTRSVESGNVQLDLNPVSVGDYIVEAVRDLEPLLRPHKLSTVVRADGTAWFDRLKVRQIVSNLLSNAAKFSPPESPILIDVAVEDGWFQVCVTDRGSGIAPEKMSKLFQKYERLGSDVKGTGLGLYISRGLARAHGGDLTVVSDGRHGCKFCLRLPVDPAGAMAPATGSRS